MENKVREIVLISDLIDKYGKDVLSCLAYVGGVYEQEEPYNPIYEEVEEKIIYTDLEKSYENITKVFKRNDGKFFKWDYMHSPYVDIEDHCNKKLIEVFPYTYEETGYL